MTQNQLQEHIEAPIETNGHVWYDDSNDAEIEEYPLTEYDIISSPNDFNVKTIFDFIERGVIKIPGFQRNFVWDIRRASKLMESIIIGIPIPQIFLYQEERNKFLVIDGQQRLMSIYYFIKERFPKKEHRADFQRIFNEEGKIPDDILDDDQYFTDFKLNLPEQLPNRKSRLQGKTYSDLGEYQIAFDERSLRCIIVKQFSSSDEEINGEIPYEIFNRLNTDGINLTAQEMRMSLSHSHFYHMLQRVNTQKAWRNLLGILELDVHMKDIEFLLRGFAMLIEGHAYKPSMVKFLNRFSRRARDYTTKELYYLELLFDSFLASCADLPKDCFQNRIKRFSITIYEAVFVAVCAEPFSQKQLVRGKIDPDSIACLKSDSQFCAATEHTTSSTSSVQTRLQRAKELVKARFFVDTFPHKVHEYTESTAAQA